MCHSNPIRSRDKYVACLRNKHILLIGDSTIGQWYDRFRQFFKETTVGARESKFSDFIESSVETRPNILVEYTSHSTPCAIARKLTRLNRRLMPPTEAYLDELDADSTAIVVVHIYAHFIRLPTTVFLARIRSIRKSIERLVARAPFVKVFVKGPHSFIWTPERLLHDIYGKLYADIFHLEFAHVQDRVVYLDNWDMTVGWGRADDVHPGPTVVTAMVDQLLAYICT
jgi:hypothetical protein